jgi:hypothetical protein
MGLQQKAAFFVRRTSILPVFRATTLFETASLKIPPANAIEWTATEIFGLALKTAFRTSLNFSWRSPPGAK